MSRATELAKAEADKAEAENPDEPTEPTEPETPAEPSPDEEEEAAEEEAPEPPAEEPVSEKSLKARNKSLQLEDQRHEKRLHEIYGSTWGDRAMCPLCLQEGFVVPYPPGTFDPQQREMVEAAMGTLEQVEYREHPTDVRCETCDGLGQMTNGSRVEGRELSPCPTCQGFGTTTKAVVTNVTPLAPPSWPVQPGNVNPVYAGPNIDNWGRPAGHPDWGRDPAQVNSYGA